VNKTLALELEELRQRDLETRSRLLAEERLYGTYDEEMQNVHVENARALDRIVSQHGWPGVSLVGLDGCRAAWMIAQHSICTPDLQRRFLDLLEEAVAKAEAPAKQAAMLTDRIRFNEDRPQVYGTVLDWDEKGVLGCRLEDIDRVDSLREEVGLPPLEKSIEENERAIAAEGGKPPEDFHAFRREFKKWARDVGSR
jgi:hypothetical protein